MGLYTSGIGTLDGNLPWVAVDVDFDGELDGFVKAYLKEFA